MNPIESQSQASTEPEAKSEVNPTNTPLEAPLNSEQSGTTSAAEHTAVNPKPASRKGKYTLKRKARPVSPSEALRFNGLALDKLKASGYTSQMATRFVQAVGAALDANGAVIDQNLANGIDEEALSRETDMLSTRHQNLRAACGLFGISEDRVMSDGEFDEPMFVTKSELRRVFNFRDYADVLLRPSMALPRDFLKIVIEFREACDKQVSALLHRDATYLAGGKLRKKFFAALSAANTFRHVLFTELNAIDRVEKTDWAKQVIEATDREMKLINDEAGEVALKAA